MKINRLYLENFKQFKNQEIIFTEGLIGFVGNNGAGKSTIFDAIFFALFGLSSKPKNDKANEKDSVLVELDFDDKEKIYQLKRILKGKSEKHEVDILCDGVIIATGVNEVKKQVTRILKIDSKNFKQSFFSEQKDVDAFILLQPRDRKTVLRIMLGFDKLDKLETCIKGQGKELDLKVEAQKKLLITEVELQNKKENEVKHSEEKEQTDNIYRVAKENFESNESDYKSAKILAREQDSKKTEHDKLSNQIQTLTVQILEKQGQVNEKKNEINQLEKKETELIQIESKKIEYDKVTDDVSCLLKEQNKFSQAEGFKNMLSQSNDNYKDSQKKLNELNKSLKIYSNIENNIIHSKNSIKKIKEEIKEIEKTKEELISNISVIKSKINERKECLTDIQKIGKDSDCPTCLRPLFEQYDFVINKYETEIQEFEKEKLNKLNEKLNEENSKFETLSTKKTKEENILEDLKRKEYEKTQIANYITEKTGDSEKFLIAIKQNEASLSEIGVIQFDLHQLKNTQQKQKVLKPDYDKYIRLQIEIWRKPNLENGINKIQNEIQELEIKHKTTKTKISEIGFDENIYNKTKSEVEEKEKKKDYANSVLNNLNLKLVNLENNISRIRNEIRQDAELRIKIDEIVIEVKFYEKLGIFINTFKTNITSVTLPTISNEASKLFSDITKNRYSDLRFDEDFELKVNREGKDVLLTSLSGGEKDLASLCLRIAISKKVAQIAGRTNMGFLALDEVFGSQDESRREELLLALIRISKDFKQIFVITHNQDVQEQFPKRIVVSKVGAFSKAMFA